MPTWGLSKYTETKLQTTCFYSGLNGNRKVQVWNMALNFYLSCFRHVVYSTLDRPFLDLHCKVYVLGNSSLLSLPVLIGLYHILIYHISYLLTTGCYVLSAKIMAKCKKKEFAGWIIFYVRTVHLSQLIFLMLPLNVLLLMNGIDYYSSDPYMGPGITFRIGRITVEIPLGAWPAFVTQFFYIVPWWPSGRISNIRNDQHQVSKAVSWNSRLKKPCTICISPAVEGELIHSVHWGIKPPQKYSFLFFVKSLRFPVPLKSKNCPNPTFSVIYLLCVGFLWTPPKNLIFQWTPIIL